MVGVPVQYKHCGYVQVATEATRDTNGNWIAGTEEDDPLEFKCRAEPQSGNGYIQGIDGAKVNYSYIVYCPLDTPNVPVGSTIKIVTEPETDWTDEVYFTDTVKRFSRGQLNVRLWL